MLIIKLPIESLLAFLLSHMMIISERLSRLTVAINLSCILSLSDITFDVGKGYDGNNVYSYVDDCLHHL